MSTAARRRDVAIATVNDVLASKEFAQGDHPRGRAGLIIDSLIGVEIEEVRDALRQAITLCDSLVEIATEQTTLLARAVDALGDAHELEVDSEELLARRDELRRKSRALIATLNEHT